MHSDAHRKLPERVKKINYLIHGNRFDLFYYLTVPVYIPGGPFRFLIHFGIVAVSFRFLTTTPQRHSSHLGVAGVGWGRAGVWWETGPGDEPTGALSRVLTPHQGSRPGSLQTPFHPLHTGGNKDLQAQGFRAAPNSRQLAGRGFNKTKELVIPSQLQPPTLVCQRDLLYSDSAFLK